jgi:hypothetical protein
MTDLYTSFAAPTPSHPSAVSHFFRSSASGRDSPRTLVADELFKLHIGTPPILEQETKPFHLEIPVGRAKRRSSFNEDSTRTPDPSTSNQDPLFGTSPTKRRSPRGASQTFLAPLEEMDISEDPPSPIPIGGRSMSPPPPDYGQDSEDDMEGLEELRPPDERTRYLRRKKRTDQIIAYRMRELKDDRELRAARRSNPLSPKSTKVTKTVCVKKVKFAL